MTSTVSVYCCLSDIILELYFYKAKSDLWFLQSRVCSRSSNNFPSNNRVRFHLLKQKCWLGVLSKRFLLNLVFMKLNNLFPVYIIDVCCLNIEREQLSRPYWIWLYCAEVSLDWRDLYCLQFREYTNVFDFIYHFLAQSCYRKSLQNYRFFFVVPKCVGFDGKCSGFDSPVNFKPPPCICLLRGLRAANIDAMYSENEN